MTSRGMNATKVRAYFQKFVKSIIFENWMLDFLTWKEDPRMLG
jgi:hypothetical protein